MSFRSNIFPTGRQFHFNPAGEDRLDGKGPETAVETPTRTIALVNALDPPPSGQLRASIVSSADGVYADGLLLPAFTTFNAPSTSVITTDAVNITAASSQPVFVGSLLNFVSDSTLYLIDGLDRVAANVETMVVGSAFATDCFGFVVSGSCGQIFARLTTGVLQGDGATLISHTATCTTPFDYNIDEVSFFNTNQTLLDFDPPGPNDQASVNITTAQRDFFSPTTGSTIFKARAGRLIAKAEVLSAETICEVFGGAEFSTDFQIGLGDIFVRDGGEMVLKSAGILVGDIVVDEGGLLNVNVNFHVGEVFEHENGTINGWIDGEPYGNAQEQVVLQGSDFTDQVPAGTDTPLQITFGAAQGSASDPVMLSAAGALTINKKKKYLIDIRLQYSRDNAGAAAWLFFRVLKNGVQFNDPVFAKIDNANNDIPIQFSSRVDTAAGDVLTFEVMRDSQGFDDGELVSETPTPGDWSPSPSASIKISI